MTELPNFVRIRELSNDYYQQRMTKEEYRSLRKTLLDKIDIELNCIESTGDGDASDEGFVDKLMSYFKNSDEEKIL